MASKHCQALTVAATGICCCELDCSKVWPASRFSVVTAIQHHYGGQGRCCWALSSVLNGLRHPAQSGASGGTPVHAVELCCCERILCFTLVMRLPSPEGLSLGLPQHAAACLHDRHVLGSWLGLQLFMPVGLRRSQR